ncbi:MAG: acylphosphatase [Bacillota bacterium]
MKRLHLKIYGRVQGVYFRSSAQDQAGALGLSGWIKNMPDGTVETVIEGGEEQLQEYKEWCKIGPPAARVEKIEERWEEPTGEFKGLSIQ